MTDGLSASRFPDPPSGGPAARETIAAVVIGRDEGARLLACLATVVPRAAPVIYVDSGSTDGSPERAAREGAEVVRLDPARPFTAARARNAGFAALLARPGPPPAYVQFLDGDCALRRGWLPRARAFLDARPEVAAVCGRRRERFPEASVYNRLCDREWDTPLGETRACGGDALIRTSALIAAGGYRDDLIAGEEPELCLRLRGLGWKTWRLEAEMCWHDAAITRFGQWWRRSRRAGFAFAAGAALHGRGAERHWVGETRRAILWGAALPAAALAALVAGALAFPPAFAGALILLAYPAQALRLARREGGGRLGAERGIFTVLGKFPEAAGVLEFRLRRRATLIEYK
ncbi:glycosyltransferase family 2 protein [Amaricoccus solimangrovi]|uniref:Glycosyltransferase n=1 Tax=Amaricoccus solimangrovi TaxID=2589815 RepID=A0A501WN20_9RHOB|nr:glycosyltransferase [Amaricoccus solimangrovi]TPE49740.1 glycosyltransferase [Amaricoccus solimangrovi]